MAAKRDDNPFLGDMSNVAAIVLGGGRGERLYPLTANRAKPAVPLLGRYRLVDIPLSNCMHSGVNRVFVLTQFNSASLNRHINRCYRFDSFSEGFVEVLAAEQTAESGEWYQGTADAVRKQLRQLRNVMAKHYLILSGDQLYRMDYRALLETHLRTKADITISALPVSKSAAKQFGLLKVTGAGRITHFVEKPQTDEALAPFGVPERLAETRGLQTRRKPYLASMGVYAFRGTVLMDLLADAESGTDFGKHLIPSSLKSRRVQAHFFKGFWEDVGTVRSYYEVSMRMLSLRAPFRFYDPRFPIYCPPRYLPGARVQKATIDNAIICEGARLRNTEVSHSVIGTRSVIQPNTVVKHTIMMGADYYDQDRLRGGTPLGIGGGSRITRAIIDKNARIGKNVVIRGSRRLPDQDGEGYAVRDGIVIVLKDAVIPSGTRIG